MYGVIEYDDSGKPICEICGIAFDRVCAHAHQVHGISAREYKVQFGLDVKKGICSNESSMASRERVFENYERCIRVNLIKCGSNSRFKDGSTGRTRDKVSEQTRISLVDRFRKIGIGRNDTKRTAD